MLLLLGVINVFFYHEPGSPPDQESTTLAPGGVT